MSDAEKWEDYFNLPRGALKAVALPEGAVPMTTDDGTIRTFESGATRDTAEDKLDYEGFFHPVVMRRFAEYMHRHRKQSDGSMRDSDNWQKGIPIDVYIKSAFRHFHAVWLDHRMGHSISQEDICALMFNVNGLLLEVMKQEERDLSPLLSVSPTNEAVARANRHAELYDEQMERGRPMFSGPYRKYGIAGALKGDGPYRDHGDENPA